MCHVNPRVSFLEFGGTKTGKEYLTGGFPVRLKRVLSEVIFQQTKSPGCKVWFLRSSSSENSLWKDCSTRAWLFLIEAVRPLQYWNTFPFISCGSKEAKAKSLGILRLSQKVENYEFQKGVDLRFRKTNGNAFNQGIWRASTNFANWVLIMSLVH